MRRVKARAFNLSCRLRIKDRAWSLEALLRTTPTHLMLTTFQTNMATFLTFELLVSAMS